MADRYQQYEGEEEEEYDEEAGQGGILVPVGSTRRAKVRDRSGQTSVRETTVLKFRACLRCSLVMSEDQFMENGCTNCPDLELDNNREAIWMHTTPNFRGLTVILRPDISWVAKYNNLTGGVPGAYAISTSAGSNQY